jgi:hypothetical protein
MQNHKFPYVCINTKAQSKQDAVFTMNNWTEATELFGIGRGETRTRSDPSEKNMSSPQIQNETRKTQEKSKVGGEA